MVNRRLIRIKAFKVLFSAVSSGDASIAEVEKNLVQSCTETLNLYYLMMNLAVALKGVADATGKKSEQKILRKQFQQISYGECGIFKVL